MAFGMVRAAEYPYLIFTGTDGTTTAVRVDGIAFSINGNTLRVSNNEGTRDFTIADLASMTFSVADTLTAIEGVMDSECEVEVFSLSGVSMGRFGKIADAVQSLPSGAYIFTNGRQTKKIVLQ